MIETQENEVAGLEEKIGNSRNEQQLVKNEMFSIRENVLDKENDLRKLERKIKREESNIEENDFDFIKQQKDDIEAAVAAQRQVIERM